MLKEVEDKLIELSLILNEKYKVAKLEIEDLEKVFSSKDRAYNNHIPNNKVIAIIGDKLLDAFFMEYIYRNVKYIDAEIMNDVRKYTTDDYLKQVMKGENLNSFLLLSKGDLFNNVGDGIEVLSATFEALTYLIYLRNGKDNLVLFISNIFKSEIEKIQYKSIEKSAL